MEDVASAPLSGVSARVGLANVERLLVGGAPIVRVHGAEGAFAALLIARLAALPGQPRPVLAVTADETSAQALARDLRFFMQSHNNVEDPLATARVAHLPHLETAPWADVSPDRR